MDPISLSETSLAAVVWLHPPRAIGATSVNRLNRCLTFPKHLVQLVRPILMEQIIRFGYTNRLVGIPHFDHLACLPKDPLATKHLVGAL